MFMINLPVETGFHWWLVVVVFVRVQVIGVNDSRMGEEVCACIKLLDGQQCTEEDIRAYCRGEVRRQRSQQAA